MAREGVLCHELHLRADGDTRSDVNSKREMLRGIDNVLAATFKPSRNCLLHTSALAREKVALAAIIFVSPFRVLG